MSAVLPRVVRVRRARRPPRAAIRSVLRVRSSAGHDHRQAGDVGIIGRARDGAPRVVRDVRGIAGAGRGVALDARVRPAHDRRRRSQIHRRRVLLSVAVVLRESDIYGRVLRQRGGAVSVFARDARGSRVRRFSRARAADVFGARASRDSRVRRQADGQLRAVVRGVRNVGEDRSHGDLARPRRVRM